MRMETPAQAAGPIVLGFTGGGFRTDEGIFRAVLLMPERAIDWTPPPLAGLGEADFAPLLAEEIEFILLGAGPSLIRPSVALTNAIEARGMGLEVMDSRAAARAWGVLRGEGRRIGAALYPLA
jgi:uncharacterized protein